MLLSSLVGLSGRLADPQRDRRCGCRHIHAL